MKEEVIKKEKKPGESSQSTLRRRSFLKYSVATTAGVALILTGCKDDDDPGTNNNTTDTVDLGSGDPGILNYAYALEQLEAAFYISVVSHSAFTTTFTAAEQAILTDIRDHEITHREFLKAALADKAIKDLEVDFTSIDFSKRDAVLGAARTFEDLGVAAYNGAGNLLSDGNLLLVAGKIVSVEARHAAAIRDLINPKSTDFAGDTVVDANGLDGAKTPTEVLTAASAFVKTKITFNNLPNS
ncbi:MAG: ferritin-like domain-containing protein [Bacteroidota bacterium]